MICKLCGAEVADSAKFCSECGAKIERQICCKKCGTILPIEARFCPECGEQVDIESTTVNYQSEETISKTSESAETQQSQLTAQEVAEIDKKIIESIFKIIKEERMQGIIYDDEQIENWIKNTMAETHKLALASKGCKN